MNKGLNKHGVSSVAVLLVMSIFAVCVLMVLLTGAGSYKRLAQRDLRVYEWRTDIQYITQKIRQSDSASAVWVAPFDDKTNINTLFLAETIKDRVYITRIYYYNGYIYELYSDEQAEMKPLDGNQIMQIKDVSFSCENGKINIKMTLDDNTQLTQTLALRSRKGD